MRSLKVGFVLAMVAFALPGGAFAQDIGLPPTPDPNFAGEITPSPCKLDTKDPVEKKLYEREGWGANTKYERYPGNCRRIHFSYGPILVKPGQNDVLVEPVTIEKPAENGYITRIKPNLVDQNGKVPPVEQVHLHHGTWLAEPSYGNSAFFAAGEEKTIAPWPKGFGMPVKQTDAWLLLYMVHSAVQNPMAVYITYDVDFIPQANGDALKLKSALPIWLDVRPSAYPVFNVQQKYGGSDGRCTWPKEACGDFDPYGKQIPGNGLPANGKGTDMKLPDAGGSFGIADNFQGGTLIGLGGHLHPGGIANEVDLVRGGKSKRIYNGIPSYWSRTDRSKAGGPPTSWDFSIRVSGLPQWGIRVNPGDVLRSNATYDTKIMSSYEDMGIAVGLLVPDDAKGKPQAPGLDPFKAPVDTSSRCTSGGLKASTPTLCPNGTYETHGHYVENANASGPAPGAKLDAANGPQTDNVAVADFIYAPGDLTTVQTTGIPTVKLGSSLTFTNADSAVIPHTITTCAFPCMGPTGAAFPLPNGVTSLGRPLDLDSSELGFGAPAISGVKNEAQWSTPITPAAGYRPNEVVTYFCRIHPSMRGAFKVVE